MVTLKEIAERSGVSIATVSNILNGKSNFSEETKEKILQVIKETGYKPNYMARTLRARKTNTIGLIVDDLMDFSSPSLIDGLMGFCEEKGYKIVLENLRYYTKIFSKWENHEEYKNAVEQAVQEMLAIKVDGIVYIASHSRNMDCLPKNLEIPVVLSYAYNDNSEIPAVLFDDESAAFEMTEYLISKGHKNIGVIMGAESSIHTQKRKLGFLRAMKKHNLVVKEKNYCYGNWTENSGYDACNTILTEDMTAIFCFNDLMAGGVYRCLHDRKLKPGVDISVAGFDDRDVCNYLFPKLTTMKLPLIEIGQKSAEILIDLINNKTDFSQKIEIKCTFVERDSVTKIN